MRDIRYHLSYMFLLTVTRKGHLRMSLEKRLITTSLRFSESEMAEIDAAVSLANAQGFRLTRTAAIRAAIRRGVRAMRADLAAAIEVEAKRVAEAPSNITSEED